MNRRVILEQLLAKNPRARELAALSNPGEGVNIEERLRALLDAQSVDVDVVEERDVSVADDSRDSKIARIREHVEDLREENSTLHGLSETLARALGACERCWGQDVECAECDGDGDPGYFEPDRDLFHQLIVPAVERVRASRRAKSSDSNVSNSKKTDKDPR